MDPDKQSSLVPWPEEHKNLRLPLSKGEDWGPEKLTVLLSVIQSINIDGGGELFSSHLI